ncbi:probable LRR receptor-like serine/threonine-protein kinase At1g06840 isoform X2 [Selaginella moellendorffii]|uniref:probable LRR receptor-like serine/threonine-protein kinase At1g06840 isoform X2 n=1 Tax=Selaginella moellendorffii TaxID=88036 RepID=UPI000D1C4A73|nr:probable LRR receptor-like serine/threonine-protein kinase At1g06840 isoform X2 [Selaginella moellendorffii]|eukprot:XP_024536850.1 probable LRR receptor-like serine/threonine-protein kinase At1g06840 isoform X2 [Selaginella moellendorffii]
MWNSLSGSIPPSIGNLLSLELLLLNGNSFTGHLPDEIGNLVNLDRLQVDQNKFSGPIPSTLTKLVNAKHLHMNDNAFDGSIPSGLGRIPAIHILLDNNNLTGKLPPDIGNISQLQILWTTILLMHRRFRARIRRRLYSLSSCKLMNDGVVLDSSLTLQEHEKLQLARIDARSLCTHQATVSGFEQKSNGRSLSEHEFALANNDRSLK